ncbi:unnamed protein product [Diamesa hyperborea]
MKKEYIMSDEDKILKRMKIDQNRAKRRASNKTSSPHEEKKHSKVKIKEEWSPSSNPDVNHKYQNHLDSNFDSESDSSSIHMSISQVSSVGHFRDVTSESSAEDIVNAIVATPKDASHVIMCLMRNQKEALSVMSRIINSPDHALTLISHFIQFPASAMLLISKIMNSPLDALSVFTQFMSSPTDALQIITKVMSSPSDVLTFMQELTNRPQEALDIMNKFMQSPAEALQLINKMINHTCSVENHHINGQNDCCMENETIKLILNKSPSSSIPSPSSSSSTTTTQQQQQQQQHVGTSVHISNSPQSLPEAHYHEAEYNNKSYLDYQKTSELLEEVVRDINEQPSQSGGSKCIDSIICEAIKLEYDAPQMHSTNFELNESENAKIEELIISNKALQTPVDTDLTEISLLISEIKSDPDNSKLDPMLLKVINLTSIAIRRLIKMSKKISAFKKMCQEDQIALLKGGCTEMMIMRSVMQYDTDRATWTIPHSQETANIHSDILKLAKGNVYEEHDRFIRNFDPKLRTDERIILILCAITLFNPNRPSTVHKDVIKLEQNSYYYLLRRYLGSVYGGCEARSIFLQLLEKIQEVHKLNEEIISVYLDVNPSQVEPLLREIFDLKV